MTITTVILMMEVVRIVAAVLAITVIIVPAVKVLAVITVCHVGGADCERNDDCEMVIAVAGITLLWSLSG